MVYSNSLGEHMGIQTLLKQTLNARCNLPKKHMKG